MAEQLTIEQLQIIISANMSKLQSEFKKVQTEINKGAKEIDRSFGKLTTNLNSVNNSLKTMNSNVTNVKKNMEALTTSVTKATNSIKEALNATNQLKTAISGVNTNIVIKTQYAENKQSNSSTADMMSSLAMGATVGKAVGNEVKAGIIQTISGSNLGKAVKNDAEAVKDVYGNVFKAVTKDYEDMITRQRKQLEKLGVKDPLKNAFKEVNIGWGSESFDEDGQREVLQETVTVYQTMMASFKETIASYVDKIKSLTGITSKQDNAVPTISAPRSFDRGSSSNMNAVQTQIQAIQNKIKPLTDKLAEIPNKIKIAVTQATYAIERGLFQVAGSTAFTKIKGSINKVSEAGKKWSNSIKDVSAKISKATISTHKYKASQDSLAKSTDRVKASTNGLIGTLKRLLPFLSVFMVFRTIGKSISSAMDSIENANLIGVVFGKDTKAIEEWADTLQDSVGVASQELQKNAATIFNMATSLGMGRDSAMDMSKALSSLAGDMASFYNISSDEAFTKLRSGITGETEALKQLGIMVDVNTLKQYGYKDAMSNSEKMMIRYQAIMAQTSTAQGDFARSIDSPANQLRLLQLQLNQTMISLGKCFMPIVQVVLPILNSFVRALNKVLGVIANFMYALFGIQMTSSGGSGGGIGAVAGDVSDLGGNLDSATASAKKLKGSLMGFDEINIMSTNKDSGSGDSGGAGAGGGSVDMDIKPNIDMTQVETPISKLAEKIRGYFAGIKFDNLIASFENLKASIKPIIDTIGESILWFIENILAPLSKWVIEDALPAFFDLLSGALKVLDPILKGFQTSFTWLWDYFLQPIAEWTGGIIVSVLEGLAVALTAIGDWMKEHQEVINVITLLVSSFALAWGAVNLAIGIWNGICLIATAITSGFAGVVAFLTSPITLVILAIGALITAGVLLAKNWDKIKEIAIEAWDKIKEKTGEAVEKIKQFFTDIKDKALEIFNAIKDDFNKWKDAMIQFGKDCWKGIKDTFSNVVSWFGQIFSDAWTAIKNVFSPVGKFFGGVWNTIKSQFTNIATSIGNAMGGAFKSTINTVINFAENTINGFIRAINRAIKLINAIPGVNINTLSTINVPRLARGGIVDKPTLMGSYIAGDSLSGGSQKEMVVPLENTSFTTKIAQAMGEAVENAMERKFPSTDNGDTRDIVIQVGSTEFARVAINSINELQGQVGATLINI
ncbi:phage tail tape measure protein [Clostridium culturomicium]|uniref:hypothetical protein n=1 Tax=Clostridium culturomicium TaxID=1499683 RepID=UPI00058F9E23|nr:hypothetical protein [Clostridium culturomicium]